MSLDVPAYMKLSGDDVKKMLIANAHIGNRNLEKAMKYYIYKRQADGVYVFNIDKTFAKLQLAARLFVAIENS